MVNYSQLQWFTKAYTIIVISVQLLPCIDLIQEKSMHTYTWYYRHLNPDPIKVEGPMENLREEPCRTRDRRPAQPFYPSLDVARQVSSGGSLRWTRMTHIPDVNVYLLLRGSQTRRQTRVEHFFYSR